MIKLEFKKKIGHESDERIFSVDFSIKKGEFFSLYGESGVGKTTLLRVLAGLEKADFGKLEVFGKTWFDTEKNIFLSPQEREIGFVFQNLALFPNMTVLEQLKFAQKDKRNEKIRENYIEIAGISDILNTKPEFLSGGQKQRVAIVRALLREPKILLLDEAFSSLDAGIQNELHHFLQKIHNEQELTTLLVSHSLAEIIKLSDRISILKKDGIEKIGTATELFFSKKSSGKLQLLAEIIKIEKSDLLYVLTVSINGNLAKIVVSENEVRNLAIGDFVSVKIKAFNPNIEKVEKHEFNR